MRDLQCLTETGGDDRKSLTPALAAFARVVEYFAVGAYYV